MSDFKLYVLDKAINEINKKTDINIKYDCLNQVELLHISYLMLRLNQLSINKLDKSTVDMFNGMSIKQVDMFGDKLSKLDRFQSHYKAEIGESTEQYAERIKP